MLSPIPGTVGCDTFLGTLPIPVEDSGTTGATLGIGAVGGAWGTGIAVG